jgi:hypothetical protein
VGPAGISEKMVVSCRLRVVSSAKAAEQRAGI